MDETKSVEQYDRVMETQLAVAYAVALEWIARSMSLERMHGTAVDLACGTGHFTCCLAQHNDFKQVVGIDLSVGMLEKARGNAEKKHVRVDFRVGDARKLDMFGDSSVSLCTFNQSAHHMPTVELVGQVMQEMDRITAPDGLILVTDLARLRTQEITDQYVSIMGSDYDQLGLPDFFADFRNSMFAAWTPQELQQAVPSNAKRNWLHYVPFGLPSFQLVVGIPQAQADVFQREEFPKLPVPRKYAVDWSLLRWSLANGRRKISPKVA
jgi:ubiquinone/menaquinone biosynthesis C-methylase UbiE